MLRLLMLGVLGLTACLLGISSEARSAILTDWTIDEAQSSVQLSLNVSVNAQPIQTVEALGAVPHVFQAGSLTTSINWNGQSSTSVSGTIATEWDSNSNLLTFLDGSQSISANQSLSGSIYGNGQGTWLTTPTIATVDGTLGTVTLQNILFDAGGSYVLSGNATGTDSGGTFGLQSGTLDAQYVQIQTILNTVPGVSTMLLSNNATTPLGSFLLSNAGSLSVASLGGDNRELTQVIDTDFELTIPLSGGAISFTGNMSGQIVALGVVPEPASSSLLVVALALASGFRRRAR